MSACIDQFFGTFRESLGKSEAYTGAWRPEHDDNKDNGSAAKKDDDAAATPAKQQQLTKAWSPHGYLGLPATWDIAVFNTFTVALFPLVWIAANGRSPAQLSPTTLAAFVAYSPPLVALLLSQLSGDKMSWRWPFAKDRFLGAFGLFLGLGWLLCIVPVHHACALLFAL